MTWTQLQAWLNAPEVQRALALIESLAGIIGFAAFTIALAIRAWQESNK